MSDDLGKLVLRVGLGVLLLFHGVHKLLNGLDPIKAMLASHNMSDSLAYGVYLGELVAPVLVIIGLFSRIGALLIAIDMLVAVVLAGLTRVLAIGPTGGYALELEAFYFVAAVAISLLGAGRFSIGSGRWN
ncbi:MAG: DoxX family protein [Alphaproteobacteria bacterium]|nr:DoxX family protein [Alphaproteobacteria bacterium]